MNWQDMANAPKDGRQILVVYIGATGLRRYGAVRWYKERWLIGRSVKNHTEVFLTPEPLKWAEIVE